MQALVSTRDLRKAYRNVAVIFSKKSTPHNHIILSTTESGVTVAAVEYTSAAICRVAVKGENTVIGHATVHSDDLKKLLEAVEANEIEITANGNSFSIRESGKVHQPVESTLALEFVEYFKACSKRRFLDTLSTEALDTLNAISKAADTDKLANTMLQRVHITKRGDYVLTEAADGYRLHQSRTPGNSAAFDVVIDLNDCKALVKLFKSTSACIYSCPHPEKSGMQMTIFSNDTVEYMIERLYTTPYPDSDRLSLSIDNSFKYTANSAQLLEDLKLFKRSIMANHKVNQYERSVILEGTDSGIVVNSVLASVSAIPASGTVYSGERRGFPVTFMYNVNYLIEALEGCSGEVDIRFSSFGTMQLTTTHARIHTRAVIMPMIQRR